LKKFDLFFLFSCFIFALQSVLCLMANNKQLVHLNLHGIPAVSDATLQACARQVNSLIKRNGSAL
jgi:hypothetical protein